jgi:hypothetical protein
MRLAENQDVVKAFLPHAAHPPFSISVGIWRLKGCANDTQAFGLENGVKGSGELAIIVVEQDPDARSIFLQGPHDLPGLLGDPPTVWMGRHAGQMDASRIQFDEEEDIQGL